MNIIFPLVSVIICFLVFLAMYFMQKRNRKYNAAEEQMKQRSIKTAQELVNVKEIDDMFLYTKDNYIITYIKVQPISIELMTDEELHDLAVNLTEGFSSERRAFKFLAISKPVDIAPLISKYSDLLSVSQDQIQKKLLRSEVRVITDFSLSGGIVEREFYYMFWTKCRDGAEKELKKSVTEFAKNINDAGIGAWILKKQSIIKLLNLVNNPALSSIETIETDATIPFINLYENVGGINEETGN